MKIYESFGLTRKQIAAFSALTGLVLRSPWFQSPEWRNLRLASCISTGLSALAPIGHTWYPWKTFHLIGVDVPYYLLDGAFLLVCCYVYEVRALFCNRLVSELMLILFLETNARGFVSRQIWYLGILPHLVHIFVALSIVAHIVRLLKALEYSHHAGCLCKALCAMLSSLSVYCLLWPSQTNSLFARTDKR